MFMEVLSSPSEQPAFENSRRAHLLPGQHTFYFLSSPASETRATQDTHPICGKPKTPGQHKFHFLSSPASETRATQETHPMFLEFVSWNLRSSDRETGTA